MSVSALRGSKQAERKLDVKEFHESEYHTCNALYTWQYCGHKEKSF